MSRENQGTGLSRRDFLATTGGAIAGAVFNLYSQSSVEQKWRSLMSGSTFTFMGCSWALTAFVGGYAIEHSGYPALFVGAAAATAAGAVTFLFSSRFIESRSPVQQS